MREVQVRSKLEVLLRENTRGDLYIINTDEKLTQTIRNTFEEHGCQVSVSKLEDNLTALYILLSKKMSVRRLKKLVENGRRFGLNFFLTKTGMVMLILNRIRNLFRHL